MTFADPDLERDWRASGATRVGAAQSAFFAAVMMVNVAARVACGDVRKIADAVRLFFRDGFATGSSPALLVRCLPTIFAGVFFAGRWAFFARETKGGGPRPRTRFALDVGDVVALLYVAAEAGTSLEATYFGDDFGGLTADAWSADDRSFFSRGALRDRTGRLCATAAVSRAASVWLAPSTARRKFVRAPVVGRLGAPIRRLRRRGGARARHRGTRSYVSSSRSSPRGRVPPRVSPQVQLPHEAPRPGEVEQAQKRDEKATGGKDVTRAYYGERGILFERVIRGTKGKRKKGLMKAPKVF